MQRRGNWFDIEQDILCCSVLRKTQVTFNFSLWNFTVTCWRYHRRLTALIECGQKSAAWIVQHTQTQGEGFTGKYLSGHRSHMSLPFSVQVHGQHLGQVMVAVHTKQGIRGRYTTKSMCTILGQRPQSGHIMPLSHLSLHIRASQLWKLKGHLCYSFPTMETEKSCE